MAKRKPRLRENSGTRPPSDGDEKPEARSDEASFWTELGLPEPRLVNQELAPTVDRDLLVRLVRGELDKEMSKLVYRLVLSFATWSKAYGDVIAEESRRTSGED